MPKELHNPYYQEFREATQPRESLIRKYSYAVPTEEAIRTLALCSPIVEIGAGTGYWAYLLDQVGADVLAFDDFVKRQEYWDEQLGTKYKEYFRVQAGGPEKVATYPTRTLFLCWPDPSPEPGVEGLAEACLKLFTGEKLAYVGCRRPDPNQRLTTGDLPFFELLATGYRLVTKCDLPSWESSDKAAALRIYRRL